MRFDLANHVGDKCVLNNGRIATIERDNPYSTNCKYAYRVVERDGTYWTVTKDGYVWANNNPNDFDIHHILNEIPMTEKVIPALEQASTSKSQKVSKKRSKKWPKIAYYDYNDDKLKFGNVLPTGHTIGIISNDVSEREANMLSRLMETIPQ